MAFLPHLRLCRVLIRTIEVAEGRFSYRARGDRRTLKVLIGS